MRFLIQNIASTPVILNEVKNLNEAKESKPAKNRKVKRKVNERDSSLRSE